MISISRKNLKIAGLVWGISLAVFLLFYMFVLKGQSETLAELKAKNKIDNPRNYELEKKKLTQQIESTKSKLAEFVVEPNDIQNLANTEIENMAKEAGLELFFIDPWSGVEVAAFSECKHVYGKTMIVRFNASFADFAKFLNMLERYKKVIFIDSFSIIRSTDEKVKHKIDMNLAVLVEKSAAPKNSKS